MSVRKWYLSEALSSYRRLLSVVDELTWDEVIACLDLEAGTQRRQSVTDRLIKRAISLTTQRLQEKYHHGKST
jgi:hypothetical protein